MLSAGEWNKTACVTIKKGEGYYEYCFNTNDVAGVFDPQDFSNVVTVKKENRPYGNLSREETLAFFNKYGLRTDRGYFVSGVATFIDNVEQFWNCLDSNDVECKNPYEEIRGSACAMVERYKTPLVYNDLCPDFTPEKLAARKFTAQELKERAKGLLAYTKLQFVRWNLLTDDEKMAAFIRNDPLTKIPEKLMEKTRFLCSMSDVSMEDVYTKLVAMYKNYVGDRERVTNQCIKYFTFIRDGAIYDS